MKTVIIVVALYFSFDSSLLAQNYTPVIEPCNCPVKTDPLLNVRCGYLVVPENRQKPKGRTIKIPFIYARKANDQAKNVTLYTTGGPGYSTIANIDSLGSGSGWFQFGGFIAFDQRGTKKSLPCLDCPEVNAAHKLAYTKNLDKDSLEQEAVKQCRKRFITQGINLSAYNSIESAEDINDLRKALQLDSLTLFGISYSGGLMLTVARNHPEAVRALILNSPLPGYVNYEEHALFNFQDALNIIFNHCETDSVHDTRYAGLKDRFEKYFTSITGKKFTIRYAEKNSHDTLTIQYTKQELLDAIINHINNAQLKEVPFVINEIINGHHNIYVKDILDNIFRGNQSLSHGMRYSVYCSEQIAYADETLVHKQEAILPWFAGYAFNNVNHAICKCWQVQPEPPVAKTPVYSNVPALITTGEADPWCSPFYNRLIKRTMPNSQLMTVRNNAHGAWLRVEGVDFAKLFMDNPYTKIVSPLKTVTIE